MTPLEKLKEKINERIKRSLVVNAEIILLLIEEIEREEAQKTCESCAHRDDIEHSACNFCVRGVDNHWEPKE